MGKRTESLVRKKGIISPFIRLVLTRRLVKFPPSAGLVSEASQQRSLIWRYR
jgi:hypothetical protein